MNSPIQLYDDIDTTLIDAPPWKRERILFAAEPTARSRTSTATAAEMRSKKFKPKFSGDRAMLTLRRELAVDPDLILIPEPSSERAALVWPLLIRLCSISALAALVAWAVVFYSAVKKSAEINASAPAITSNHDNVVDMQPTQLRPTLSQTADPLIPTAESPPVVVATAATEVIASLPTSVTAPPVAETSAPAPAPDANDRRALRLDSEEVAILVKRGNDFIANGDFAAARLLLRRAAEAGSAEGAFALGTTFDPVMLQRLGAIGAAPDLAEARRWYQRAAELGSRTASQQLAGLADAR
jgi:hypothetical protein